MSNVAKVHEVWTDVDSHIKTVNDLDKYLLVDETGRPRILSFLSRIEDEEKLEEVKKIVPYYVYNYEKIKEDLIVGKNSIQVNLDDMDSRLVNSQLSSSEVTRIAMGLPTIRYIENMEEYLSQEFTGMEVTVINGDNYVVHQVAFDDYLVLGTKVTANDKRKLTQWIAKERAGYRGIMYITKSNKQHWLNADRGRYEQMWFNSEGLGLKEGVNTFGNITYTFEKEVIEEIGAVMFTALKTDLLGETIRLVGIQYA